MRNVRASRRTLYADPRTSASMDSCYVPSRDSHGHRSPREIRRDLQAQGLGSVDTHQELGVRSTRATGTSGPALLRPMMVSFNGTPPRTPQSARPISGTIRIGRPLRYPCSRAACDHSQGHHLQGDIVQSDWKHHLASRHHPETVTFRRTVEPPRLRALDRAYLRPTAPRSRHASRRVCSWIRCAMAVRARCTTAPMTTIMTKPPPRRERCMSDRRPWSHGGGFPPSSATWVSFIANERRIAINASPNSASTRPPAIDQSVRSRVRLASAPGRASSANT